VVARVNLVVLALTGFHFMLQLITILNRCHRFPGFVYRQARFSSDHKSIEIAVRPRKGSSAQGFVRSLFTLPSPCPRIRSTLRAPFRVHPLLGLFGFSAVLNAAR
jgi:hypothetical protein